MPNNEPEGQITSAATAATTPITPGQSITPNPPTTSTLAVSVATALDESGLRTPRRSEGDYRFLCTGDAEAFRELGSRFLQMPIEHVEHVAFVKPRETPHPFRSFTQPIRLANEAALARVPKTFIYCSSPATGPRNWSRNCDSGSAWTIQTTAGASRSDT